MKWDAVVSALDKLSSTSRRREMVQSMMDALRAICEGVGGGEGASLVQLDTFFFTLSTILFSITICVAVVVVS